MPQDTAFVLGGGGVLGSTQVGMLRALFERGEVPDLVLGASVGALNGAAVAAYPDASCVGRLTDLWMSLTRSGVFSDSVVTQAVRLARQRTHLHSPSPLRTLLVDNLPGSDFADLAVPFQCVAASIEDAGAQWFHSGPIADAVIASCSVPGLFPPAEIDGRHYFDGGLVHSIPVGRAVQLGARRIFVLHVGRIERPLSPPRWPWQVGLVAFEIARRHRFVEEMAQIPDGVEVHVLPSGEQNTPTVNVRYRSDADIGRRMERAYEASAEYLKRVP